MSFIIIKSGNFLLFFFFAVFHFIVASRFFHWRLNLGETVVNVIVVLILVMSLVSLLPSTKIMSFIQTIVVLSVFFLVCNAFLSFF